MSPKVDTELWDYSYKVFRWHPQNQMSSSESWPRKVELTCAYSRKAKPKPLHITTKPVFVPMKTSLMSVIFIS